MDLAFRVNFISNTIHKCLMKNVLKLKKSVSFRGLRPLDSDQGFAVDPLGDSIFKIQDFISSKSNLQIIYIEKQNMIA